MKMSEDKAVDEFFKYAIFIGIFILVVVCIGMVSGHGNVSVYAYDTNYVIWDVGGNTLIWLDGVETQVSGLTYGQYDLQPNTEHIACNIDGNCTGITTKPDSWSVLSQWGIYFVLMLMALCAYFIPIMFFPGVGFGTYLLTIYLPDIEASGNEYIFVAILIVIGACASIIGYENRR